MSKSAGKRIRGDSASTKRRSAGAKSKARRKHRHEHRKLLLVPVLIILLAYIILCANAAAAQRIFPNTCVLGVNLGGMTQETAEAVLTDAVTDAYEDQNITIQVGDDLVSVSLAGLIELDCTQAAEAAMAVNQGNVLTGGIRYLRALLFGCTVDASPFISFDNLDSVYDTIQDEADPDTAVVQTSWELTETQVILTKGTSGQTVDEEALQEEIFAVLESGDFTAVIACPMTITSPDDFDLQAVYDEIYTEPVSACCDDDANVIEDVQGISFDLETAQVLYLSAQEGDTVSIDLILTDADVTAEELSELLFRDVLGTASSTVSGTSARKNNVKLAAESVTGTILNPGESFSYNDTVGERTTERGYQAAAAYSSGDTVQEVGGGICQVSSTLYLSTLYANLQIDERRNHSYICSYMPYGMDATVSWGGPDFVFTNNTDYPIRLVLTYSGGVLTSTICGTNLTGEYVEVTNEVTSTTSYETVYEDTTELAVGQTSVKTSGYNGMTVKVYRNVYASDGTLISSTLESNNTYKVRNKVILRGVASTASDTESTDDTETEAEEGTASTDEAAQDAQSADAAETAGSTQTEESTQDASSDDAEIAEADAEAAGSG